MTEAAGPSNDSPLSGPNDKMACFVRDILKAFEEAAGEQLLDARSAELNRDVIEALVQEGLHLRETRLLLAADGAFQAAAAVCSRLGVDVSRQLLLQLRVEILLHVEQFEHALEVATLLYRESLQLMRDGESSLGDMLAFGACAFVRLNGQAGDVEKARGMLSEVRLLCHKAKSQVGEISTGFLLVLICLSEKELDTAREYAVSLIPLCAHSGLKAFFSGLDAAEELSQLLTSVARDFYYEQNDFKSAESLAAESLKLSSANQTAYFFLGNSLMRQEKFSAAAEIWKKALQAFPEDPTFHYNCGTAVARDGLYEDALKYLTQAIALRPDPRYFRDRARIHQALEHYQEAIDDFRSTATISLAQKPDGEAPAAFRDRIDYERNMPAEDVAFFAQCAVVNCYLAWGRYDSALEELSKLGKMTVRLDVNERAVVCLLQGRVLEAKRNPKLALSAYAETIQLQPEGQLGRSERANLLISMERIDEALQDLAFLARHEAEVAFQVERGSLETVIQLLDKLLQVKPGYPLALKWRGLAYFREGYSSKADADLLAAAQLLPEDTEIHFYRGLCQIYTTPEEKGSMESLPWEKLITAFNEIGQAARLDPANPEYLAAYKWLFDRASTDSLIRDYLITFGDEPEGIYQIIPGIQPAMVDYRESLRMSEKRDWASAVKVLQRTQESLMALDLPLFATRLHVHLADNYLRLYNLQAAMDHIRSAEKFPDILGRPLSSNLRDRSKTMKGELFNQSGRESLVMELEYIRIYAIGFERLYQHLTLVKSELALRLGDPQKAVTLLKKLDALDDVESQLKQGTPIQAYIAVAVIFREAGQPERSLEFLQKALPHAKDPWDEAGVLNTIGTIYAKSNMDEAEKCFERVRELMVKAGRWNWGVMINLAQCRLSRGDAAGALALLEEVDDIDKGEAAHDITTYWFMKAEILAELSRVEEAHACISMALDLIENSRQALTRLDARMGFFARYLNIYHSALLIALRMNNWNEAWSIVERSKARALLDQLVAGHLPLPPEAGQLEKAHLSLLEQRRTLSALRDSMDGADLVDYELLAKLKTIGRNIDALKDQATGQFSVIRTQEELDSLYRDIRNLEENIELQRSAAARGHAGAILSFEEVQSVLGTDGSVI
ncbi:MAG TPA: tetratricopeptide repeat protein [Candidatus Angelobacter sp.]|nr:tetratricopeptide repeat protein [Candidatus Angelobacter sp.]